MMTMEMVWSWDTTEQIAPSIVDYWKAGGWPLLPLGIVALILFCRYFLIRDELNRALSTPDAAMGELEKAVSEGGDLQGVYREAGRWSGAVARIVRHTAARMQAGLPFRSAFKQCREAELARFSDSFVVLAGIVAAAPLLGLLGTVLGMVETFEAVGQGAADGADSVADGISKALLTTQAGLAVAVPGTFALAHLRRKLRSLRNKIDRCESHLNVIFETRQGPE
ncbi:MAG: MotA/TolQ/ExbB proton channel family protein [Candidatus Brocadiia bacterium]